MKSIYRFFLLLTFIFPCASAYAQDTTDYTNLIPIEGLKYKKTIISFAANTDLELMKPVSFNFGGEFGAYIRLFSKAKKIKNKSIYDYKIADRDLFIKPTVGFLFRERYHTGIYFMPSLVYRHTTPKIFFIELNADAGYYYAKLNAPTYEQQTNGGFKKISGGFSQAIVGGKFITGLDFSKSFDTPINLFAGFGVYYTYPNNNNWTRHIIIQAGMSFIIRRNIE
jgi:hypothetical protein